MYLLALGFGLGGYVALSDGQPYLKFLAPGIVASSGMFAASFECTYGTFFRMTMQKTFDAILATPVSVEEVVTGEILWGTSRALMAAVATLLVAFALGLPDSALAVLTLPLAAVAGLLFSSIAVIFSSIAPSFYFFNYFVTLGLTPMFMFGGVFFPLTPLPAGVQQIAWLMPLSHVVAVNRSLFAGDINWGLGIDAAWVVAVGFVAYYLAIVLMRRRLVK